MSSIPLRLSVEELALVLNQIGRADKADELISARYGSLGREDIGIRLVTAGNSLMARGLLTPEKEKTLNILDGRLAQMGKEIADATYTIWGCLNSKDKVSYHFSKGVIIENTVEQNVVHILTELNDPDEVYQSALGIFGVFHAEAFDCPPVTIPNTALSDFLVEKDAVPLLKRLNDPDSEVKIPEKTKEMFAEDWENARDWGLLMRIEHHEKGSAPIFDRGFLILRGPKRFWIMRPTTVVGQAMMELMPATTEVFVKELETLL